MASKNRNKVVSDLTKGMIVEGMQLAIKSGGLVDYNNKKGKYIRLNVSDSTGDCVVIMWDDNEPEKVWEKVEGNKVIEVDGRVDEYNGNIQVIADNIFPVKDYDPSLFVPKTNKDIDEAFAYLVKNARTVTRKPYKKILTHFLDDYGDDFKNSVGAKAIHHAEIGGLVVHTYEVLTIVNSMVKLFNVDRGLLRTATILHDIGKMVTYDIGATIERNQNDYLLGHIFTGIKIIDDIISKYNIEISTEDYNQLIHLILNHHDHAPEHDQVTYTKESIILRKADGLSMMLDRFENIEYSFADTHDIYYDAITKMQYYLKK